MINDTREDWKGNMRLYISAGDETNIEEILNCELGGLEKKVYTKSLPLPEEKGEYKLVAEIIYRGESVKSIRDFAVQ